MTQSYYSQHAFSYAEATAHLEPVDALFQMRDFLPPPAYILDAGCGSGRDSAWFRRRGYAVDPFDLCPELCEEARRRFSVPARVASILDLAINAEYDGVWACASLVHFNRDEACCALRNLSRALKPGGYLYFSVKEGQGESLDSLGRFYRYWSVDEIRVLLREAAPQLGFPGIWCARPSFDTEGAGFINLIARKNP